MEDKKHTPDCGCKRKHMEPFKCTFVPESAVVSFILGIPALTEAVYQLHEWYVAQIDVRKYHSSHWKQAGRTYRTHPQVRAFSALVQLKFNYMPSTIATGDFITRFVWIYKRHRERILTRKVEGYKP